MKTAELRYTRKHSAGPDMITTASSRTMSGPWFSALPMRDSILTIACIRP